MQIVKEKLDIDEKLEKKINNLLKFNNIKAKLENGNIISLTNTNIAYIEPHTLEIKGITYLFFNECNKCKTYVREYKIVELLIDEITDIIEYGSIVKKHFAPLLKKKLENTNELLSKELYILKDKVCGSYITGNPSTHSDLDVHIILNENVNYRERGNKIVDGLLIEYFKDDYTNVRPMSQTQIPTRTEHQHIYIYKRQTDF